MPKVANEISPRYTRGRYRARPPRIRVIVDHFKIPCVAEKELMKGTVDEHQSSTCADGNSGKRNDDENQRQEQGRMVHWSATCKKLMMKKEEKKKEEFQLHLSAQDRILLGANSRLIISRLASGPGNTIALLEKKNCLQV
ncbi:hypothetical protein EVAR_79839_1 [Eumeta japonica]|uniref:Uncharacterized protein n=1 Tax=Eumeta variegata TaxID=151549 RepID=A0A4C1TZ27_EUMVA|nr:hypothetical protein EVAR_79839_1 [Eumeta japonica]